MSVYKCISLYINAVLNCKCIEICRNACVWTFAVSRWLTSSKEVRGIKRHSLCQDGHGIVDFHGVLRKVAANSSCSGHLPCVEITLVSIPPLQEKVHKKHQFFMRTNRRHSQREINANKSIKLSLDLPPLPSSCVFSRQVTKIESYELFSARITFILCSLSCTTRNSSTRLSYQYQDSVW